MENYSVVLFILAIMILLSGVADKIRLPYPILLIVAGIIIGFIPSIPDAELDPDVIFLLPSASQKDWAFLIRPIPSSKGKA